VIIVSLVVRVHGWECVRKWDWVRSAKLHFCARGVGRAGWTAPCGMSAVVGFIAVECGEALGFRKDLVGDGEARGLVEFFEFGGQFRLPGNPFGARGRRSPQPSSAVDAILASTVSSTSSSRLSSTVWSKCSRASLLRTRVLAVRPCSRAAMEERRLPAEPRDCAALARADSIFLEEDMRFLS